MSLFRGLLEVPVPVGYGRENSAALKLLEYIKPITQKRRVIGLMSRGGPV